MNPGNKGFQKILQSEYVDKTGLIALINKNTGTTDMLTCISRDAIEKQEKQSEV